MESLYIPATVDNPFFTLSILIDMLPTDFDVVFLFDPVAYAFAIVAPLLCIPRMFTLPEVLLSLIVIFPIVVNPTSEPEFV